MTRAGGSRASLAGWLVAALVAAPLLGCASAPRTERSVLAGNPARNLLILPLNVAAVMPSELEVARPIVWEELEIYLRAQGKELKTLSLEAARGLWIASVREARAKDARAGYDEAARVLVAKLSQYAAFDAVIAPSLFVRKARIAGRSASWDGVERPLEIEAAERLPADFPLEGVAPAASLHAVVLDPNGDKIQEATAGLELLVDVRVVRKRGWSTDAAPSAAATSLEFTPRTDPLASREHVRESIARALAGFLPPPPRVGD